jgi:small-conductance mechanosensitive channel
MNLMEIFENLPENINEQLRQIGINVNNWVGEVIVATFIFLLTFVLGWIIYHIFEHYFTNWAKKTKTTLDDEIIKNIKKPIYFFVILLGLYYGLEQLSILESYKTEVALIFAIGQILLIVFIITRVINVLVSWYAEKSTKIRKKVIDNRILNIFKKFLHAIVYLIGFLFILNAFHIDLSGIVIGVGVGGIAIAFALQNVLSDVFSAFSIYFDRPFEVGDFIVVGQHSGTVTKIGMKSTRLQLLQGEEMIVSNREITSTSVRNYRKMTRRRVEFIIRVAPNTPLKKLKDIPQLIEKTIKACNSTEFDMVHFREIGSFSYNFEVVYYINTGDYLKFLDIHEKVNFAMKETFEKEKIEFAFQNKPTSIK